ncbi:MAG: hypothetical protein D6798_12580 [Deltaproteobacteria bacterium]|nr:MAG: hypothetical protein D6798_12580 [Deltaproteobacteria bacterium]
MTRSRRLVYALVTAVALLAGVELLLRGLSAATGRDFRVDPLPAPEPTAVLCEFGDLLRLCPDQGPSYERVRPLVFARQPDRPRVVAIGESFVYGLGLPTEQAWPARLQAHLHDAGIDAEVLNLGRCGTYASRLIPLVEAAIALQADAVVIAAGNNEHTMTSFYAGPAGRHPLAVYRISRRLGRLQLYGLLATAIGIPPRVEESPSAPPARFGTEIDAQVYAARRRPPDLHVFQRPDLPPGIHLASARVTRILEQEQRLKEEIFADHLATMLDMLREAGIPTVVCTLPHDLTAPPVLSGVHRAPEAAVVAMINRLERPPDGRDPADPADLLRRAVDLDPAVSYFQYKLGQHRLQTGARSAAVDALRAAVEWDLVPDVTPSINRITATTATARGLPVVDLARHADAWLAEPGRYYLDKVHVNARGADEIGEILAPVVADVLPRRSPGGARSAP